MTKIVINRQHGGFGLTVEAMALYEKYVGHDIDLFDWEIPRDDPNLVRVVEELKERAANRYSYLKVVEIPDDVAWEICEYDGVEWIAEQHRTWR